MDLKLKVIGNASAVQNKQEKNPDGSIKVTPVNQSRISARDETGNILQFTTDYESGKKFELDRELTITIN